MEGLVSKNFNYGQYIRPGDFGPLLFGLAVLPVIFLKGGENMQGDLFDRDRALATKAVVEVRPFDLGKLTVTRGINDRIADDIDFAKFVQISLQRHARCDWGDVCKEDHKENEYALDNNLRLFSVYKDPELGTIWIITEANRYCTTVLFPEEY